MSRDQGINVHFSRTRARAHARALIVPCHSLIAKRLL